MVWFRMLTSFWALVGKQYIIRYIVESALVHRENVEKKNKKYEKRDEVRQATSIFKSQKAEPTLCSCFFFVQTGGDSISKSIKGSHYVCHQ